MSFGWYVSSFFDLLLFVVIIRCCSAVLLFSLFFFVPFIFFSSNLLATTSHIFVFHRVKGVFFFFWEREIHIVCTHACTYISSTPYSTIARRRTCLSLSCTYLPFPTSPSPIPQCSMWIPGITLLHECRCN